MSDISVDPLAGLEGEDLELMTQAMEEMKADPVFDQSTPERRLEKQNERILKLEDQWCDQRSDRAETVLRATTDRWTEAMKANDLKNRDEGMAATEQRIKGAIAIRNAGVESGFFARAAVAKRGLFSRAG